MAVTQQTPINTFAANGATTVFPFNFLVLSSADLVVKYTDASGVTTTKTLGTDYSVTGIGVSAGGTVTFVTPPAVGTVAIYRDTQIARTVDYQNNGDFLAATVNSDFDRPLLIMQEVFAGGKAPTSSVRAPNGELLDALPAAATRAGYYLGFDGSGQPTLLAASAGTAAALSSDLASTASTKGPALIGWLRAATGAVATTLSRWMSARDLNVFEFLTTAQIADVQAYTYALDLSTPVQAAINAAWASGKKLVFPPGGYKCNSLAIYENGPEASRVLWMEGTGVGNPFTAGSAAGTIIKGTINDPVFSVYTPAFSTSSGTLKIKGITFLGNSSTAPVVFLESFYGTSEVSDCVIRQEGVGNGMQVQVMATCSIHNCYFLNRDLVTFGLGASRVGVGLWIDQQYDAGLQTITKCTSRGFLTAYRIGATAGTGLTYNASMYDCECSLTYHGVHITGRSKATRIDNTYCEGGEGGYAFWDEADFTTISRSYAFPGYGVHIKSTDFTYGNTYDSNVLIAGTTANQVLIDVTSSGTPSGPGKTVSNNHLSFGGSGGSIAGVIGLRINGSEPRISMPGNTFFPRGAWTGGAGTFKALDLSASSDGTSGSGLYGLRTAMSRSGSQEFPALARGAINLAVDPTALNNTNVSAGVLTIGEGSVFSLTPTANVAITSITAPNLADKTFSIHVTATAFAVTFTNGALLKLAGSANLVTGANGCWISFQVKPGGVAWETARVVY